MHCRRASVGLFVVGVMLAAIEAQGQVPVPRLQSVFPLGARQGTSVELTFAGGNLDEPKQLYFSHPGIQAELLPAADKQPPKFRVTVKPDVPVGGYDVRLVGYWGVSNARTFTVGDTPEAEEQEPNNEQKQATRVALDSTMNGRMGQSEDVDWFVFSAQRGQRVLIECKAWRIDSRLDGYMWLYDASGKELAASQDEDLRDEKRDPFLDIEIPADGDYHVKLIDFTFNGSNDHFYRLGLTTGPYIDFVLPTGVQRGQSAELTVFGRNLPGGKPSGAAIRGRPLDRALVPWGASEIRDQLVSSVSIRPAAARLDGSELRIASPAGSSNGRWIVASELEEVLEQEPNSAPTEAQPIKPGMAVSGQFERAKDVDHFRFTGKKGVKYAVEVYGQLIGSPADPELEVLGPKGNLIGTPQDNNENIGQIRFTTSNRDVHHEFDAPEDGEYTLRVEHLYGQMQGGPQYTYRLELREKPAPDFRLVCVPPHETRLDSPLVLRGGRQRLDVLVWRQFGHNAPITLEARNLPAGVTCEPFTVGPDVKWGTLVVTAKEDAPLGFGEIEIVGRSEIDGVKREHRAAGGGIVWDTVNTPAIARMSRSIVLAVRDAAPMNLTVSPAAVTIKEGESFEVKFHVDRRGEFTGPVEATGAGYDLPRGLEIPLTTLPAGQSDATLKLKADKMKPGTYSFMIQGAGQTSFKNPAGGAQTTRATFPSNTISLVVEPKAK